MEADSEAVKHFSVVVENVFKKYIGAKTNILNGITMKVPTGAMYGLLGPSGCGKTTLLKCILGKADIDCGTIQISATKWKHIGYMPQDISLHEELLIKELFKFYSTIYKIPDNVQRERIDQLSQLFELPSFNQKVSDCSGGQKRRISLVVTLLHDPNILVLDEPTVGLDPLLAHNIMNYLISLSVNDKKTIVITTHYMEEARNLNLVGLMRHGVLLAEDNPGALINRYSCESLDEVFIHVINSCHTNDVLSSDVEKEKVEFKLKPFLQSDKTFTNSHLKALLYKNYKFAIRNLWVSFVTLMLPLITMYIMVVGMAKLEAPNGIGYYNDELNNNKSCSMNQTIIADECIPSKFYSCEFISIISKKIRFKEYKTLEDGMESLKRGEVGAMIYFPSNFSFSIVDRMSFRLNDFDDKFIDEQMQIWFDNSMFFSAIIARSTVYKTLLELVENKCEECGIDPRLAQSTTSMRLQPLVYGDKATHLSSWLPGITLGVLVYLTYFYTSSMLHAEKQSGVLERDQMNGVTTAEILASTLINQFIVMNIQTSSTLYLLYGIFGHHMEGSHLLAYIVVLLSNIFGSLYGVLTVLFTSRSLFVALNGINLYFFNVFLNGGCWPVEGIYWLLQSVVRYIPSTAISITYNHIILHGFTLTNYLVYPGFIYIISANGFLLLLIYLKLRFSNWQL